MADATTVDTAARPGVKRLIGVDFDFGALRKSPPRYWAFVSLLFILFALGMTGWALLMGRGGEVLAMRDDYPWGLWFINYMYYVGLSAGGLAVYASVHLFGAEQFKPLSRLAVLLAGVLVMMALLGIFTDMERPWRMLWFLATPNLTAPFVYTGSAAGAYMVLCFADLWILITGKGGESLAFKMTLIALPFAVYLHTTTAFVLALNKSRELWNAAVMVPIFLTSATASGVALLMIAAYVMKHYGVLKNLKPSMFRSLSTLLLTVIALDLFLILVEIITVFWPTSAKPGHSDRMALFFENPYGWFFLPVLILGGISFALLARRSTRGNPTVQITAAALYVLAVFFKRYSLMAMGFAINPLGQYAPPYFPSTVELLIALGILSLGLLIVTFSAKVLPLQVPEEEHVKEPVEERAPASSELVPEPALSQAAPETGAEGALEAG